MRLANADNFILRELAGNFYLVNVAKRKDFCVPIVLNETGADILRPMLDGKNADEAAAHISSEYGIDLQMAKKDVLAFLEHLRMSGLELLS